MHYRPNTTRAARTSKQLPSRRLSGPERKSLHYLRSRSPGITRRDGARARPRHARRIALTKGAKRAAQSVLEPGLSRDASIIESRVQALSTDQLLDRYHGLVDQRLAGHIQLPESFELDRIESRLNVDDEREISRITSFHKEWERERSELVTSIEGLLARFKTAL